MRIQHITLIIICLLKAASLCAQNEQEESRLKAEYIYNFTRFVEWDSTTVGETFVIGIVGTTPVNKAIRGIAKTRLVNNKKIEVKYISQKRKIKNCNLLFISNNATIPLETILEIAKERNILVVSEKENDALRGAGFNFVHVDDQLKFEANPTAIAAARLKVSAQLLKLAIIVN